MLDGRREPGLGLALRGAAGGEQQVDLAGRQGRPSARHGQCGVFGAATHAPKGLVDHLDRIARRQAIGTGAGEAFQRGHLDLPSAGRQRPCDQPEDDQDHAQRVHGSPPSPTRQPSVTGSVGQGT